MANYLTKERLARADFLLINDATINSYEIALYDDAKEILLPNNVGEFFRVIDLCWLIALGQTIPDACSQFRIHPLRFMSFRLKFPEVDNLMQRAFELAGEADIERASRLMADMTTSNIDLTKAKSQFYVWRGKHRYSRMYGDKHPGLSVNVDNRSTKVEIASVVRERLEDHSRERPAIDLNRNEYVVED